MKTGTLTSLVLCIALGGAAGAPTRGFLPAGGFATEGVSAAAWRAQAHDNICGLRDLEQLSMPAKLDFERCLAATPEMKRMKREGIRPQ